MADIYDVNNQNILMIDVDKEDASDICNDVYDEDIENVCSMSTTLHVDPPKLLNKSNEFATKDHRMDYDDDWDSDENDDDDDKINVIIDNTRKTEIEQIRTDLNRIYQQQNEVINNQRWNDYVNSSSLLMRELEALSRKNLKEENLSYKKLVILSLYDLVIPIDASTTQLSSALQTAIWKQERRREIFRLKLLQPFNEWMGALYSKTKNRVPDNECVAYFAATYDNEINKNYVKAFARDLNIKSVSTSDLLTLGAGVSVDLDDDFAEKYKTTNNDMVGNGKTVDDLLAMPINSNNSRENIAENYDKIRMHFYKEFSVIIMRNGQFKDAAIHGYRNNIASILDDYDVKMVYVNCNVGSALDIFLNYKYQPFFEALHKRRLVYLRGSLNVNKNTIMFCDRKNSYCSFCRCINTIFKHYTINKIDIPTIKKNTKLLFNNYVKCNSYGRNERKFRFTRVDRNKRNGGKYVKNVESSQSPSSYTKSSNKYYKASRYS